MAREQEEELGLERGAAPPGAEFVEERILLLVEHHRRADARRQPLGKQGLARADRPFDGEIPEVQVRAV